MSIIAIRWVLNISHFSISILHAICIKADCRSFLVSFCLNLWSGSLFTWWSLKLAELQNHNFILFFFYDLSLRAVTNFLSNIPLRWEIQFLTWWSVSTSGLSMYALKVPWQEMKNAIIIILKCRSFKRKYSCQLNLSV